jgi:hypothetical protein
MLALGINDSITLDTCSGFTAFAASILLAPNPQNSSSLATTTLLSACTIRGAVTLQFNNSGPARTVFAFIGGVCVCVCMCVCVCVSIQNSSSSHTSSSLPHTHTDDQPGSSIFGVNYNIKIGE